MIPDRSETDSEGKTRYFYSAATIRKWLEEVPSSAMLESVFQVKAHDPEQQSVADIITRAVHLDLFERVIAVKLQSLEGGE